MKRQSFVGGRKQKGFMLHKLGAYKLARQESD
jgi:hypothetical protein